MHKYRIFLKVKDGTVIEIPNQRNVDELTTNENIMMCEWNKECQYMIPLENIFYVERIEY